jgi:hypothetical protein
VPEAVGDRSGSEVTSRMGDASMPGSVWQPQRSRKAVGVLAGRPLPWTSRERPSVQQGMLACVTPVTGQEKDTSRGCQESAAWNFSRRLAETSVRVRSSFIFTGHRDTRMAVEWRTAGSSQSSRSPSFATFLTPLPAYRTPWLEPPTRAGQSKSLKIFPFQGDRLPCDLAEALKAWFYPGDHSGVEFVYSTQG